jgi:hypothetical protein
VTFHRRQGVIQVADDGVAQAIPIVLDHRGGDFWMLLQRRYIEGGTAVDVVSAQDVQQAPKVEVDEENFGKGR